MSTNTPFVQAVMARCAQPHNRISLSNAMFVIVGLSWCVIGYGIYAVEARAVQNRKTITALTEAVVASDQVVVVCNAEGIITSVNPPGAAMFGGSAIGTQIHQHCPPEHREAADKAFAAVVGEVQRTRAPVVLTFEHAVVLKGSNKQDWKGQLMIRAVPDSRSGGVLIVAVFTPQKSIRALQDVLSHD